MSLAVLIPLSLALGLIGLGAFFWALRDGQFEDLDGAAWRIVPLDTPLESKGHDHDKLAPDTPDRRTRGRL
ncbi:MAG: cbb3-type cytochrome oxidase assembly protein CcoS [Brucellaceae bacterium]|nr:cbb3-type cytochrome oxidase assembly protein CcoS [Brucellaceae bacterium]